jgi:hypothetical protein
MYSLKERLFRQNWQGKTRLYKLQSLSYCWWSLGIENHTQNMINTPTCTSKRSCGFRHAGCDSANITLAFTTVVIAVTSVAIVDAGRTQSHSSTRAFRIKCCASGCGAKEDCFETNIGSYKFSSTSDTK